jgi:hypothetical protein
MKMEKKLSDFSAELWKWNGYTKMKREFRGTEMEMNFFRWKQKRKWNNIFWFYRRINVISVSN